MKKSLLIILAAVLVLSLVPATALTVSATPTEIEVEWITKDSATFDDYGATGDYTGGAYIDAQLNGTYFGQFRRHGNDYVFTKVFTVPQAGTKITYSESASTGVSTGSAPFSRWILKDGCDGTDDAADYELDKWFPMYPSNSKMYNVTVGDNITYTYITTKPNEKMRLCFNATGDTLADVVVYAETGFDYSGNDCLLNAVYNPDGTIDGINWFPGYIGSGTNSSNKNRLAIQANKYSYSSLVVVPAGMTISFVDAVSTSLGDTTNAYASNSAYAFAAFKSSIAVDTDNKTALIPAATTGCYTNGTDGNGNPTRTYTYTNNTNKTEFIRMSYQSSATQNAVWPTEGFPVVTWSFGAGKTPAIATETGASVRMSADYATSGIRFMTEIDKSFYDAMVAEFGAADVTVGTIITLDSIKTAAGGMTLEKLDAYSAANGGKTTYIETTAGKPFSADADSYTYVGSVVNMLPENYNKSYVATTYIKVGDMYYYSATDSGVRTVQYVANAAYSDTVAESETGYLNLIEGEGDTYAGRYSPYTTEQRAILKTLTGA